MKSEGFFPCPVHFSVDAEFLLFVFLSQPFYFHTEKKKQSESERHSVVSDSL